MGVRSSAFSTEYARKMQRAGSIAADRKGDEATYIKLLEIE